MLCAIYKMALDIVTNDAVAWTIIKITSAYKYAGMLV